LYVRAIIQILFFLICVILCPEIFVSFGISNGVCCSQGVCLDL